jgi:hypothetical protein
LETLDNAKLAFGLIAMLRRADEIMKNKKEFSL